MAASPRDMLDSPFGNWLRQQRRRLDWTQEHLAAVAFCSVSAIRKIESGDLMPSRDLALQLAHTFAIPAGRHDAFLRFARNLSQDFLAESQPQPESSPGRLHPEEIVYSPPAPLTTLIGREREMQSGVALLRRANVRLMTLVGPPGAGKTRLSLALGAALQGDLAQGVCFIPLAPITEPELVLSAIAQALGLREVGGKPLAQSLHEFLRTRHLLLILDNFEQVVEAAPLISQILAAAPGVKALVSSREPLRLYGEHEFPVPPLAVPDVNHLPTPDLLEMYPAVDLFLQRAQAVRPDFVIDSRNAAAVAHICAWLDGLPLAIEMAAAHIKWKTPETLLQQLRQQLMALTGSQRDLSPRQQTLRGAIDWSYKLLSQQERRLLQALSVTNGGCTVGMAAELSGNDEETCAALLRGLAEKSLVRWSGENAGDERVTLFEMIREYAQAEAVAAGSHDALCELHGSLYLRLVQENLHRVRGMDGEAALNLLEAEHNNLRAALAWHLRASSVRGVRLATLLADSLWGIRGHFSEARLWLGKLLDAAAHLSTDGTAETPGWCALARMAMGQGDLPAAERIAATAQSLAFANENHSEMRMALLCRAAISLHQSDYPSATSFYRQVLSLCLAENSGDRAMALNGLGLIAKDRGDFAGALELHEQARTLFGAAGDGIGVARSLTYASIAAYWQADYPRCVALSTEAIDLQRGIGDVTSVAYGRDVQGMALVRMGRFDEGLEILEACVDTFAAIGDRSGEAVILVDIGHARYLLGTFAAAYQNFHEALEIALAIGDRRRQAFCLEGLVMTLVRLSAAQSPMDKAGVVRAVELAGQAESLRRRIAAPLPPVEQAEYDACLDLARELLPAEEFAGAFAGDRNAPAP